MSRKNFKEKLQGKLQKKIKDGSRGSTGIAGKTEKKS